MSKLQKWCPNTPQVSQPLGAQFLCWHQLPMENTQR